MITAPFRVLLVDDVPAVREALSWALENTPELRVVGQVGDGLAALAAADQLQPDIVILDIELPHLNGYQVAQTLKQTDSCPLIIFLTIHADEHSRHHALAVGGDAFVEKGQGWPVLISQIRQLLAKHRL
ncbi:MAG: response regulator [Anaerolineae bacterium]|nr:response regulator [Anaerolineae bacterium]